MREVLEMAAGALEVDRPLQEMALEAVDLAPHHQKSRGSTKIRNTAQDPWETLDTLESQGMALHHGRLDGPVAL